MEIDSFYDLCRYTYYVKGVLFGLKIFLYKVIFLEIEFSENIWAGPGRARPAGRQARPARPQGRKWAPQTPHFPQVV